VYQESNVGCLLYHHDMRFEYTEMELVYLHPPVIPPLKAESVVGDH